MAEIIVRDIDPAVVERLKERARKNGHSLEGEARIILEHSANLDRSADEEKLSLSEFGKVCDDFRRKFKGRKFPDSVELIREDRDR